MSREDQIAGLERRLYVLRAGRKPCGSCSGFSFKEFHGKIEQCHCGTGFAQHQPRHQGRKRDRQQLIRIAERQLAELRRAS